MWKERVIQKTYLLVHFTGAINPFRREFYIIRSSQRKATAEQAEHIIISHRGTEHGGRR